MTAENRPVLALKRNGDRRLGYLRLNQRAMQLLEPGGILISCSCSMHLAARQQGRRLQIRERGFQAPDHPVHPAIPETSYLKALFCRLPEA